MSDDSVSLKKSVAATLIKKVFGIYFVLTIIVTFVQLTVEYFHVKESITNDIRKMEGTFGPSIAEALWNYNNSQLHSIIFGMNELSTVVGVRIDDSKEGRVIGAMGVILGGEGQILVTPEGQRLASSDTTFTPLKGLFSHSFDIERDDTVNDEPYAVGRATVYSASGVVIERIKYGFFLIIVNSVIKTAALWFIIFYFVRRIIGKPLAALTGTTEKMNPNNPDFFEIRYSPEEERLLRSEDELGVLTRSFDRMRNAILERMDNLHRLRNIGEDLAVIREIPAAFRRILKTMTEKFGFERGSLFLTEDRNMFEMTACHPDTEDIVTGSGTFRMGEGMTGKAAKKGEMVYMPDRPDFAEEGSPSGSLLSVPLTDEGGLSGVMNFYGTGGQFGLTDENRVFIEAVARLTVINIKNIQMVEMIREHARLRQEMEIARHIQSVLLPEKPGMTGYDIAASLEPAEEVGGDYYDVISVAGYDWLVIGDVSGHGVTAGLVMMMVQTAIHTVLLDDPDVPPSRLLSVINRTIYSNLERMDESKHMTIVVLAAGSDGHFQFAGLHEDILIRRAATGKVEAVETDGMWIGIEPDISQWLSTDTLKLEPGDCMVLFTDGITEARDKEDGRMFGDDRLAKIIKESGNRPASEMHKNIIATLEPYERPDDVTLVVVRRAE